MHRFAIVTLVVACGSPKPVVAPTPSGPPYLALFEAGHAWTLPIDIASGHIVPSFAQEQTAHGTVTCTVSDVRRIGDATASKLTCAKPYDDLSIGGIWVAAPAGLYHPALPLDGPDDLAMLTDDDLLINAVPRERQHSHTVDLTQEAVEAWQFEKAWCVRDGVTADPDRRAFTICFDAGGISGGADLVIADHVWRRAMFGHAPEDFDDPTRGPVESE